MGETRYYIADVTSLGMVGAKSDQQQEAYEVLRMMMDMKISEWVVSTGNFTNNTMCPVHVENAKLFIDAVENSGLDVFLDYEPNTREEMYNVPKQALTEEMKHEIGNVLDHIEVRVRDEELFSLIQECVKPYFESNSTDYESCYQDVMMIVENYYK